MKKYTVNQKQKKIADYIHPAAAYAVIKERDYVNFVKLQALAYPFQ